MSVSIQLIALLLVLAFAGSAGATSELPIFDQCTVAGLPGPNFMLPSGTGERMDADDGSVDTTILVQMACSDGPCILLPFQDIYVEGPAGSNLSFCHLGNASHANTNGQGETHFTYPLRGGGWADGGVRVYFAGYVLPGALDDLRINSPDINGDLVVDLADIGRFAEDFHGGYHFRSDFVADGVLNMADVGRLALGLGDRCD